MNITFCVVGIVSKNMFFFQNDQVFSFQIRKARRYGGLVVVAIIAWENVLVIYFHNYETMSILQVGQGI